MRSVQADTREALKRWGKLSPERQAELLAICEEQMAANPQEIDTAGYVIEFDTMGQRPERVVSVLFGMNIDSDGTEVYLWPSDVEAHRKDDLLLSHG